MEWLGNRGLAGVTRKAAEPRTEIRPSHVLVGSHSGCGRIDDRSCSQSEVDAKNPHFPGQTELSLVGMASPSTHYGVHPHGFTCHQVVLGHDRATASAQRSDLGTPYLRLEASVRMWVWAC